MVKFIKMHEYDLSIHGNSKSTNSSKHFQHELALKITHWHSASSCAGKPETVPHTFCILMLVRGGGGSLHSLVTLM